MALEVLELIPLVFVGLVGVELVVTGRRWIPWYPYGVREGWRLRVFGVVACLLAVVFAYWTIESPLGLDAAAGLYLAVGFGLWVSYRRWRKEGV
jgi:hypothetical protein